MRPQTFELFKKYGFSQMTFFGKVWNTNIDYESLLKFDSAHLVYKSTNFMKKYFW